jgi:hypothetical protein
MKNPMCATIGTHGVSAEANNIKTVVCTLNTDRSGKSRLFIEQAHLLSILWTVLLTNHQRYWML